MPVLRNYNGLILFTAGVEPRYFNLASDELMMFIVSICNELNIKEVSRLSLSLVNIISLLNCLFTSGFHIINTMNGKIVITNFNHILV